MLCPDYQDQQVSILSCVVFRTPCVESTGFETMLAIAHRKERLPLELVEKVHGRDLSIVWRCSDGLIEQVSIAQDHADCRAIWDLITGSGILVAEFMDSAPGREEQRTTRTTRTKKT